MYEKKFATMGEKEQKMARAMFFDAQITDDFWYLFTSGGLIISRNTIKQVTEINETPSA